MQLNTPTTNRKLILIPGTNCIFFFNLKFLILVICMLFCHRIIILCGLIPPINQVIIIIIIRRRRRRRRRRGVGYQKGIPKYYTLFSFFKKF